MRTRWAAASIRLCDLAEPETLSAKLDELLLHHNALFRGLGAPEFEKQALLDGLLALAPQLLPYAEPVWERLDEARHTGKRVLFEGAQAVMLDVDHGTYPYVTSSNTVAGNAAAGAGVGPDAIGFVLGIAKAYATRVGSGPFPSELFDATGKLLGERGREFGTVTGRPRRCGWFDACLVRQAVKVGGINGLVLTKLDVLDGLPELKICTGYRINGEIGEAAARRAARPGGGGADLRDDGGLERLDPRRAVLCRIAGRGGEVCPPHRGTGGSADRAAVHQPRARRHHHDARPLRGVAARTRGRKPPAGPRGCRPVAWRGHRPLHGAGHPSTARVRMDGQPGVGTRALGAPRHHRPVAWPDRRQAA